MKAEATGSKRRKLPIESELVAFAFRWKMRTENDLSLPPLGGRNR